MKRFWRMIAATMVLAAALCVGACASDFDAAAEDLSAIGMFRGTGTGFELDRAPTRAEAAIMLVRLYGAEEEAAADYAAGEIAHPFADVPSFAAPHVAWLYEKGLTKGMSADTFGATDGCSAQNYTTFLLRALGYQDGEDFAYADALTFAQEKGFYTPFLFGGDFLRDDLAGVTYQALAADMKDGDAYLLESLVDSGAVDAQAAKPMTEKMENYRVLSKALVDDDTAAMDLDIMAALDLTMVLGDQAVTTETYTTGRMKMDVRDQEDVKLEYVTTTEVGGVPAGEIGMWMKDGWVYMSVDDGVESQKIKYPVGDDMATLEELEVPEVTAMDVSDLAIIKELTAEKDGSDTVYTMVIGENFGGAMDSVLEMTGEELDSAALDFSEMTVRYVIDRSGKVKEMQLVFSFAAGTQFPDEQTGGMTTMELIYDYDMTMKVNATGSKVKVSYPSFSGFEEVDPNALVTEPVA